MAMIADAPGFDTLSYARRLKDAGVDEKQAEAHAEAVRNAITQGVASKVDLDKGFSALKANIVRIEDKMDAMATAMATKTDVAKLETRMAYRFLGIAIGIVIANAGVIVAAVVALVSLLP